MFLAVGVEHETRMSCILLSFVACPAVQHFSTLSQKIKCRGEEGGLPNIKFVILCTLSETFLALRRYEREILPKMYIGFHVGPVAQSL